MEKTVREQVEEAVSRCGEIELAIEEATASRPPSVSPARLSDMLTERGNSWVMCAKVFLDNAALFASSEEVAKERDDLRALLTRMALEMDSAATVAEEQGEYRFREEFERWRNVILAATTPTPPHPIQERANR